ncbi:hypothetical protein CRUP_013126 [Coryphaenoides rupestris]|nr:hypothetical protein CRUP_013126 [Coryphaenoides rupestris]
MNEVIVKSERGTFFGLAIYGDFIFWSDWARQAVLRSNKFTGGDTKVLRANIPQPMGIVAVASDTNNCELSPCRHQNGGCGDLCLLTPDGRNSSCNIHTEFECGNGQCISYQFTCDGVAHCKDKSDEKMQYCDIRSCRRGFRPCNNQRCVANSHFCNGMDDCGDNSDEAFCVNDNGDAVFRGAGSSDVMCGASEWACHDGSCVSASARCNQVIDCADASDEKSCILLAVAEPHAGDAFPAGTRNVAFLTLLGVGH